MKKRIYFIIFVFKIYIFTHVNISYTSEYYSKLEKCIIEKKFLYNDEQIMSNYYTSQHGYSKNYYYYKGGAEIYYNFFYFIIALEDEDLLEYNKKAHIYNLKSNEKIDRIPPLSKLMILMSVMFLIFISVAIYYF